MAQPLRNNLTIYDHVAGQWWSDDIRWVRTLKNMVPGRLGWFDRHIDWPGKDVLDLGCAGGFMAEALDDRGAHVTGHRPRARGHRRRPRPCRRGRPGIRYDVGVGEALPYCDASFDAWSASTCWSMCKACRVIAEVTASCVPAGCSCSTRSTATRRAVCHDHHGRGRAAAAAQGHA